MESSAVSRIDNLRRHFQPDSPYPQGIKVSPEVSEALSAGNPVVALESTIISHGMPYPKNLETAKEVETIVRDNGAVPATIAILNGVPCIGLNSEELELLAKLGSRVQKTARRDIAYVVAMRANGATTVSSTMFFASKVGISLFVTGGIGGVHRHGENTLDISSDLTELGRTPVTVVSAGVKSILDIPRTLEYLETQGVSVAAYGTNELPAFFTESSGCKAPCRVDSPEDCARLIYANAKLGLGSGILIAVPIPKEHSASGRMIEDAIQKAIQEARFRKRRTSIKPFLYCEFVSLFWLFWTFLPNFLLVIVFRDRAVTGNAETPFLLSRVNELTGGASLASSILSFFLGWLFGLKQFWHSENRFPTKYKTSDIALVKNNARVGAGIAVALAELKRNRDRNDGKVRVDRT